MKPPSKAREGRVMGVDLMGEDIMTGIEITEQPIGSEYQDIVKVLKSLIIEHSLPLWSGEGWDPAAGGFVEKLDIEGRADLAAPRCSRLGAIDRCFAKAAVGLYPPNGELARRIFVRTDL
jgi:hypothetical protein